MREARVMRSARCVMRARASRRSAGNVLVMRVLASLLLVAAACACSDVDDHLAAGRIVEACERARRASRTAEGDASEEVQTFRAWLLANTKVKARLVPHDEVRAALGGPVVGYGDAASGIGLFELTSEVPSGVASIERPESALRSLELVARMTPLVKLARAPHVDGIDESALAP
jgi:hypothetical protein